MLARPQQYAAPDGTSPHANSEPAASATNRSPPATGSGTRLQMLRYSFPHLVVTAPLSPNCPNAAHPQQYARLSCVRPHENAPPAVIDRKRKSPSTAVGIGVDAVVLPS